MMLVLVSNLLEYEPPALLAVNTGPYPVDQLSLAQILLCRILNNCFVCYFISIRNRGVVVKAQGVEVVF